MLEKIIQKLEKISASPTLGRREFVASVVSLIGAGCRSSACRSPEYVFDPAEERELSSILNSATVDKEKYAGAVSLWPKHRKIWPALKTKAARERFTSLIISQDMTDKEHYLYDDPADPDYKPCRVENFKGIDDSEFRKCIADRVESIDEDNPMTCRHFTRKFMWAYGRAGEKLSYTPEHSRYDIPLVPRKFFLPAREVEIIRPEMIEINADGTESRKRPRPHSVAAVWLADTPLSFTSVREFNNPENWYFFEPQNDARLFTAPAYLELVPGNVFLIYPEHDLPLDSRTTRPMNVFKDNNYREVLSFAVNKSKKLIPAIFLGARERTQHVYEHAAHQKNAPLIINHLSQIHAEERWPERVLSAISASGNFTDLEIRSFNGWRAYLGHPETTFLPEGTDAVVKEFFSHRAAYFSRKDISSSCREPEFKAAFRYLEKLGLLTSEEVTTYRK
ncbi:hypothetical protein J4479_03335 [Candidatus Woesearchaeota archaeon]|nr:hypothetical protein [Candidatus Woesearchaeota archaeon]